MLFAAYGDCMNLEQMNKCCPRSNVVGTGYIYGWNLVFNKTVDVRKSDNEDDYIPVVIWDIVSEDLDRLDKNEDYPNRYDHVAVEVEFEDGIVDVAFIYVMQDSYGICPPDRRYFDSIVKNAIENDIDIEYLYDALDYSYENDTSKNC